MIGRFGITILTLCRHHMNGLHEITNRMQLGKYNKSIFRATNWKSMPLISAEEYATRAFFRTIPPSSLASLLFSATFVLFDSRFCFNILLSYSKIGGSLFPWSLWKLSFFPCILWALHYVSLMCAKYSLFPKFIPNSICFLTHFWFFLGTPEPLYNSHYYKSFSWFFIKQNLQLNIS